MGEGGQLHWFDSAVNATSLYLKFPLMIGKAYELLVELVSQLSQSQDHCGFSWVRYESMKRPSALRQMMHMPHTLCAHGWAQLVQPTGGKRVLWFQSRCWKQPFGGVGWHESEIDNPHSPSEIKSEAVLYSSLSLIPPSLYPNSIWWQLTLNSCITPVTPGSQLHFITQLYCFIFPCFILLHA